MRNFDLLVIMAFTTFIIGCSRCKDKPPCNNDITVINQSMVSKVIWMSLLDPDTTYHCDYQKNGIAKNLSTDISYVQDGCWQEALSDKQLQIFVMDSAIYADSSCAIIQSNPMLYQRVHLSKGQLETSNWTYSIDD